MVSRSRKREAHARARSLQAHDGYIDYWVCMVLIGRGTDFWLGGPTRRLPKPADVLSKNPDSLPRDLVLLATREVWSKQ